VRGLLPYLFCLAGLLLPVVGGIIGPGVPAGDWTPEMQAQLKKRLIVSDVGAVLFLIGVIWVLVRWLRHRSSRKESFA
jgi:hypothetical protein